VGHILYRVREKSGNTYRFFSGTKFDNESQFSSLFISVINQFIFRVDMFASMGNQGRKSVLQYIVERQSNA
jgi:hypothetical protein